MGQASQEGNPIGIGEGHVAEVQCEPRASMERDIARSPQYLHPAARHLTIEPQRNLGDGRPSI